LTESYKDANLSGRKIVVVYPGDEGIVIDNKKDVFDDLGGLNAKPEARIRKFYLPEFFSAFKSFVSGDSVLLFDAYDTGSVAKSLVKKEIQLAVSADSAPRRYTIPEKTSVQGMGLDSAVFVVIQRMEFKRNNFHIDYYWDDKSRRPANLEADLDLIVWDYKNDAPVFYGTLTERTEFQFSMQRKHWDASASDLAKRIIRTIRCL
jgi:hypothetical protein